MKRKLQSKLTLTIVMLLFTAISAIAQVTTSSISGLIKDSKGETLPGATLAVTHLPSGTSYSAVTNKDGLYRLPALRVGGPYKVEISFIGYNKSTFSDITLQLGQEFILNASLTEGGIALNEVVVSTKKGITSAKSGASTNISREQITTLPTFSRSVTDFTRLTPQASGTSFAGRDSRYNNTTVDGAAVNNSFGLSSDPLPGGGAQPISIEAYDEVSVNIAPFDVKQSGFTGAGIYATTRSGTNAIHGSVYGFYKDQSYNGSKINSTDISSTITDSKTKIYGITVGGPIIKNKLFYFFNYENEESTVPGIAYSPTGGSGTGIVAATPIADLKSVSDHLLAKYNYSTGGYDNFPSFAPQNKKLLVKLDWNINKSNKFTVKYSHLNATSDNQLNGTSIANGGSYTAFNATTLVAYTSATRLPNSRYSNQSIGFENSNYGFENDVKTGTAELNSTINSKMSNQLLFAFKKYDNPRIYPGSKFPTIDIFNGTGGNYITAGMDPFTNNNQVIDNTTSITDNFTYFVGKHTLTAGVNYEYQRIGNAFMAGSNSHYIYNSLNDFLTDKSPIYYSHTYSLTGEDKVYSANLKVGQLSFYGQDEYKVSDRLKLTFGLRTDKPIFLLDPVENPQMTALQLPDQNGNLKSYNTGKWPKIKNVFSPRVAFRATVLKDNSMVLRGGMGIFTGRVPYVFLTNMVSNTGMTQFGGVATAAQLTGITFKTDPTTYSSLFPQSAGTAVQSASVVLDANYKFPQVFRSNLGIEKDLGDGFKATFEALYTKDIYATKMRNANLKSATGVLNEGDLSRVRYIGTGTSNAVASVDNRIYQNLSSVIVLENTSKGYSAALTAQLEKSFKNGLSASLAYTYTASKEVTANPGSTASSVWNANPNVGTSNDIELGNSGYYVPHRVVAYASYKFNYLKHGSTSIGLYYQGSANGSPISYTIDGDLNGDGNNAADLMYIPKKASELTFSNYTATVSGVTYNFTPQQQAAALEQFISNSPYLKKHRGQYAQRNAAFSPWYDRIDATASQEFYITTGKDMKKHTLQFNATLLNLPNLLNSYWGIQKIATYNNPLTYKSIDVNGVATYNMRQLNGKLVTNPFQDSNSSSTTWSLLLGAKYNF